MNTFRTWTRGLIVSAMLAAGGSTAIASSVTTGWQPFASYEGRFSVMMPEAPDYSDVKRDLGFGQTTFRLFHVRTATESYVVTYHDFPASLDRKSVLNGVRDGAVNAGTILSESDTALDGQSAKLITAAKPDGTVFACAFFFAGSRMYVMMYMHTNGDPTKDLVNGMAFIRSFQLAR
jgi:hypothetical protein